MNRSLRISFVLLGFISAGCAHRSALKVGKDRVAIETVITRVSHFVDHKQWPELQALYADSVETDYTSLFGGQVQQQRRQDLVQGWRTVLTPVVTQHQLGPIEVDITGDEARAATHVRGYHFLKGAPSGEEWMVAGHYVFALRKAKDGWKIIKMKLETFYQTGNTRLLQEAAARKS